jgi:hypothetical protein
MKIQDLATKPFRRTNTLHASSWRAVKVNDTERHIYHYSTLMAVVADGRLTQVSEGWGSMSDKCGMARLRRAFA